MFILWGWGKKTVKEHGSTAPSQCRHCHNNVAFKLLTVREWFTLFFIPCIPYSTKHYLACPICKYAVCLTKAQLEQEIKGKAAWQADLIQAGYPSGAVPTPPPIVDEPSDLPITPSGN